MAVLFCFADATVSTMSSSAYWDALAAALPSELVDHWVTEDGEPINNSLFFEIADYILANLDSQYAANILEVGCGSARILKAIKQVSPKHNLVGLDTSSGMISRALDCSKDILLLPMDLLEYERLMTVENPRLFDLIYVHSTVQYFPSSQYLMAWCECTTKILRKGGSLILIDTPISWYLNQMKSSSLRSLIKDKLKRITPNLISTFVNKRIKRELINESIGSYSIKVPKFSPHWADPEELMRFGKHNFKTSRMVYQDFPSKPIAYKKFRPIFEFLDKY
jgi:SAM-dependent methyltransferase